MQAEDELTSDGFTTDLVALCKKYGAVIFARRDLLRTYVSAEIGSAGERVWLDFTRISGEGATCYPDAPR